MTQHRSHLERPEVIHVRRRLWESKEYGYNVLALHALDHGRGWAQSVVQRDTGRAYMLTRVHVEYDQ